MDDNTKINVSGSHNYYTIDEFKKHYKESIDNPDKFWGEVAKLIDWYKKPTKIKNVSYAKDNLSIKWYEDGQLNACYNTVDRHAIKNPDKIAITWEADDRNKKKKYLIGN